MVESIADAGWHFIGGVCPRSVPSYLGAGRMREGA
jgi:hypothetical protein